MNNEKHRNRERPNEYTSSQVLEEKETSQVHKKTGILYNVKAAVRRGQLATILETIKSIKSFFVQGDKITHSAA